jgi:hypothetical protein
LKNKELVIAGRELLQHYEGVTFGDKILAKSHGSASVGPDTKSSAGLRGQDPESEGRTVRPLS